MRLYGLKKLDLLLCWLVQWRTPRLNIMHQLTKFVEICLRNKSKIHVIWKWKDAEFKCISLWSTFVQYIFMSLFASTIITNWWGKRKCKKKNELNQSRILLKINMDNTMFKDAVTWYDFSSDFQTTCSGKSFGAQGREKGLISHKSKNSTSTIYKCI